MAVFLVRYISKYNILLINKAVSFEQQGPICQNRVCLFVGSSTFPYYFLITELQIRQVNADNSKMFLLFLNKNML